MRNQSIFGLLLAIVVFQFPLFAGGPENAVVVVNAESQSSLLLANHYIDLRNVPARNVVYLKGIPKREVINVKDFKEKILGPILETIKERQLANADYIIYSSDFPAVVNITPHRDKLVELAAEQGSPIGNKKIFHPYASINALTYYADAVMRDEPGYITLNSNFYYRVPSLSALSAPFGGQDQMNFEAAVKFVKDEDYSDAIETFLDLAKRHPGQLAVSYWLARTYSLNGDFESAARWLEKAGKQGWVYKNYAENDKAFKLALDAPVFRKAIDEIPDLPFKFMHTHGFKRAFVWGPNGSVNGSPDQGRRYYLSTILGVTRNQGCTEQEALASLKRNAVVDSTMPAGTFYFCDTKDVRNKTRLPNYKDAIESLKAMGKKARVVKAKVPAGFDDVLGVTMGTASFDWKGSRSTLVPGAIGDNLTSYGGRMNKPGQTQCTAFMAAGAAGASGTVFEPYAIQNKFPHPMIHVHYARGCTLAESFYQSVHGPFQLLIVGDALCKPFARVPKFTAQGIEARSTISGRVEAELDFSESNVGVQFLELYVNGKLMGRNPYSNRIAFDSTKLPDGFHEIRVVAGADNLIQSTYSQTFPVFVKNEGNRIDLECDANTVPLEEKVTLQTVSNFGNRVELWQNSRKLAEKDGRSVEFEVRARVLGRGPVELYAVAVDENDVRVQSVPVRLDVTGKIATTKQNTEKK